MTAKSIQIVEVGPRDGLQSEEKHLSVADRLTFIQKAVDAGVRRVEVASFVNPKRVPQMAHAEEVIAALPERDDVTYIGLVLNYRGFERARETGIKEIGCAIGVSETFNQRNQGAPIKETLDAWKKMAKGAQEAGMRAQMTISTSFGCPFEGEISSEAVVALSKRVAEAEPIEICLADTIGVCVPNQATDLFGMLKDAIPDTPLRAHFHNTRNTGLANAWAAMEAGVETLDSSIGGIGGCPFAPRATGNIPTDDLVFMLERGGVDTGIDLDAIIATSAWLEGILEKDVPSMVAKAGGFPATA